MNFNKNYIFMKSLIPLFFVIICQIGNAYGAKTHYATNGFNRQFVVSYSYFQSYISEEEDLFTEEFYSSIMDFESAAIEQSIQINRTEDSYVNFEFNKITQSALFPLHHDLPPPKSTFPI